MIVLRGLLENVLGNYPCIRGYATLGDLAKISKTDESFQRDIIPEHKEAITNFYEMGKNVFFSEIILALNINNGDVNFTHDSMSQDILIKNSEIKGAMIELTANQSKPMDQNTDNPKTLRNVALRLNTDFSLQNKPFVRIDGNHRLQAAEDSNESNLNKMCPFCIILFSYGNSSDNLNQDNNQSIDQVQQSIIFHNINSKSRSLTSEEALKGIFDASRYEDDDLKADMGWKYVFARKIHSSLRFDHIQDIHKVFRDKERSTLVELIEFLNEEELIKPEQESLALFNSCIASANQIYRDNSNLSDDKTIFIAIFYYIYREFKDNPERSSSTNLKIAYAFVNWLIHNHMCNVVLEHPREIVKIYNKLHDNEVKIFMAMPYYNPSSVRDYNDALDTVVEEIKNIHPHINLSNYRIMTNDSPTHNIVVDIFEKIDSCEIFIADITNNNANVLYEYGYAKGRDKPCILLLNKNEKKEDAKSDYGLDLRFEFNGHGSLKDNLRDQILSTLKTFSYVL